MNKETLKALAKDFVDLNKPVATQKLASKLQKHVKIIYYVLSAFLVLGALRAIVSLFTGNISLAILDLLLTVAYFVVVRLFGELLLLAQLPETPAVEQKPAEKAAKKTAETPAKAEKAE